MKTFEELESGVRSYCRLFPAVFDTARGSRLTDVEGKSYVDFFCGAGALNYGHHDEGMRAALISYLERDAVVHGLDMATTARRDFLRTFQEVILEPRGMDYRLQFPGPTGANAIEAALKTARKATGRENVIAFTNAFHGMTLGALALTSNEHYRGGAGVPLRNASLTSFERSGAEGDSLEDLEALLQSTSGRPEAPAAVVLETVQAEGGVHVASEPWLRRVAGLAREHGALFIVDDIQVGCGRTGSFFSFESSGLEPDLVCLSKSLSGYGLPLSMVMIKPELDVLSPGEHSGTFRANNLALVTAAQALGYWQTDELSAAVGVKAETVSRSLGRLAERHQSLGVRGRGLIWGLDTGSGEIGERARGEAFERGLLIETVGAGGSVLKLLPPLVIGDEDLESGLRILEASVEAALDRGVR
jgi:diaminobutyrate-2-oxoglutarate transaminase